MHMDVTLCVDRGLLCFGQSKKGVDCVGGLGPARARPMGQLLGLCKFASLHRHWAQASVTWIKRCIAVCYFTRYGFMMLEDHDI